MHIFSQLQDVFGLGHRSNVNLVFDFMETDLEVSICFTVFFRNETIDMNQC